MVTAIRETKSLYDHLSEEETALFYDLLPETKANVQWWLRLALRDKVGETPVSILAHTLDMTPMIEITITRPKFWRPGMVREAYLLQRLGVDPEKCWRKMDDHRYREEITNSLNTMLAMKRLGIEHEGFESAVRAWVRRNS
ncbi:hypothetical protein CGA70_11910 [Salmonella enterica subsp. enterica serovar Mbandaka]|nr:hypothetical protein [Salmonella enterica subsp. enterica serovar Mbandaka]